MLVYLLIATMLLLCFICVRTMLIQLKKQPPIKLSIADYIKLSLSGIIAFIADTIGMGSFAVNIALAKLLNTFPDDELPAVNNGAQIIPGTIESLFFMKSVHVDLTTLFVLIAGTCLGGVIGGAVVSRLSKQAVRFAMLICFALIIVLLSANQFGMMPLGGNVQALVGHQLVLGFIGVMICGMLTSVGIGLFVLVQSVLFLMNVSPLVAFPIMTTAGAMQQPLTTLMFLRNGKIPLKKTLILSLAGCLGVFITIPFLTHLSVSWLHILLLIIVTYNFIAVARTYFAKRPHEPLADAVTQ